METGNDCRGQQAVAHIAEAISQATDLVSGVVSLDELGALADQLPALKSQLDALDSTVLVEAERSGLAAARGYRTVSQMVADRTGADAKDVRAGLRVAKWIQDFPELDAAWKTGRLLSKHVDVIRRVVDKNAATHAALFGDQEQFIEWAADYDFADFESICVYWLNAVDPDGDTPKEQIEKTRFRASKRADGRVKINGDLDPLTGAAFMTAFEAEKQKLFRDQNDDGSKSGGRDAKSDAQLGADAIMNLVIKGSAREDGVQVEPLINIVMSEQVAEDLLRRLDEPNIGPLPLAFGDIDKRCELIDGTPLHPNYVLATLGKATFRRQIMTATGRTIDVSVNARCFTPWQKQALLVQARGRCQRRGCKTPFKWLEADHIEAHSRGGPTRLDNGQILCSPDNKHKRDKPAA